MICENCGQRPATIHQTMIMNGVKQESHLCEVCAREKPEFALKGVFSFPNLSMQQLLSSFLGQDYATGTVAPPRQAEPKCQQCGLTYSEFVNGGLLGCAHCYQNFEPHLISLIKRIHGSITHSGKVPKRTGAVVRRRREMDDMKHQLTVAVMQERFEEAARLRDRIKALEAETLAGGDGGAVE